MFVKYEYRGIEFVYDVLSKDIYANGRKISHDDENQIFDDDYYPTFEDWVEENYDLHIL